MLNELYIQKSFCLLGKSLDFCYNCKYCRLGDNSTDNFNYDTLPSVINPLFSSFPIAINLMYGDPMLQISHTVKLLQNLEKVNYKGPIVIITKGPFNKFPYIDSNLDIHFAFSTFGVDSVLDGGCRKTFLSNLRESSKRDKYKYSIEFRPIVYNINDDLGTIEWIMQQANNFNLPVGYSGLQGKPLIASEWKKRNLPLFPYPGFKFGHKKIINDEVENRIQDIALKYMVPIFRKTSCLVSYTHNLERDYNAHYYRPSEMGCNNCTMVRKCLSFKDRVKPDVINYLPFKHNVVKKQKHECILKQKGICEFPTEDCSNINGQLIKTDEKLTTADVRVTKWLTGMTVDADFTESSFLSNFWRTQ